MNATKDAIKPTTKDNNTRLNKTTGKLKTTSGDKTNAVIKGSTAINKPDPRTISTGIDFNLNLSTKNTASNTREATKNTITFFHPKMPTSSTFSVNKATRNEKASATPDFFKI